VGGVGRRNVGITVAVVAQELWRNHGEISHSKRGYDFARTSEMGIVIVVKDG